MRQRHDGRRDVWRDQLQKGWSHLRSGICYGGSGFIGHKSYTAQAAPRANWMPEERQTHFHEQYAKNLQNDSLFWGTWINNMFDYGSVRRPYGVNGAGLVTIDRRERKDAFYLYKALWNKEEPTLHITDKRRTLRDGERQAFHIYSSAGAPTLLAGADTLAVTEYATCQYPHGFGVAAGHGRNQGHRRAVARQRDAQSRQRLKTETASGPSANSKSATDKLGWKGIRSEKTCT